MSGLPRSLNPQGFHAGRQGVGIKTEQFRRPFGAGNLPVRLGQGAYQVVSFELPHFGHPFSPGHFVPSILYRDGLTTLPGQRQLVDLQ